MKQKLLIILSVIFSTQTLASEYNITDQCQVFMLEREVEPSSIEKAKAFNEKIQNI